MPPSQITIKATIRDFTPAHPDFEMPPGAAELAAFPDNAGFGLVQGIVKDTLGPNGKPVYAGNPKTLWTNGKEQFDKWYNTNDIQSTMTDYVLTLNRTSAGTYVFDSGNDGFFPIDGKLLGNSGKDDKGKEHNFHFTLEAKCEFTYQGGEIFSFSGDDDLWIFINNKLVIDLGGVHPKIDASKTPAAVVKLDAVAAKIGLEKGKKYPLHVFYAERHTTQSNCRIETSIVIDPQTTPVNAQIVAAGDAQKFNPATNGAFKVKLDKPAPVGGISVNYAIVSGDPNAAVPGTDFEPLSSSVLVNGTEATISVKPKASQNVDAHKPLTLKLLPGTNYTPNPATATIKIHDKAEVTPALPTVSVSSGGDAKRPGSDIQGGQCRVTPATNSFFTITRTNEKSDQPLEVTFNLNGDAALNTDYEMPGLAPSSVTIAAGQTSVKLPMNPKPVPGLRNKDMTISVTLQEVGGKYHLGNGNASLALRKGDLKCAVQP